ncbi:MAG: DUF58 domain-containing protein [Lachnospiraceae bacterium]|nr:DUF58 domain-containing protein [Lachnospiraceae bacterium]
MIIIIILLGILALYFLQRLLYTKLWNNGLDIRIEFEDKANYEGEMSSMTETVTNRNFLPLPFLHAKFEVGAGLDFQDKENLKTSDKNYRNDIFAILFYQRIRRRLPFVCKKRGYYYIERANLQGTDLFYSALLLQDYPQNVGFYVYPKRLDISSLDQPLRKMIGEVTCRTFLYPDPFEFKGLRDYTISDPMKTINWKASAKTGDLMVNLYDSTTTRRIVILLDFEDDLLVRHFPLYEESIRLAAAIASKMLAEGFPVKIISNGFDCQTKEPMPDLFARGVAEAEDISRLLSRIDLNQKSPEFAPVIRKQTEDPDFRSAGYILITPCMKKNVQESMVRLSEEASCLYITPLYRNIPSKLSLPSSVEEIRWEVAGYA